MRNIKVKLDKYEYRAIVNIVNEYRKEQIKNGKPVDFISEVLQTLLEKAR